MVEFTTMPEDLPKYDVESTQKGKGKAREGSLNGESFGMNIAKFPHCYAQSN